MPQSPNHHTAVSFLPAAQDRSGGRRPWYAVRAGTAIYVIALSISFAILSRVPLWHTDLWGHLQYGEIICTRQALPKTDPIMPLASKSRLVDSAWLSQVIAYQVFDHVGLAGLQCLYAGSITACCAILIWIGVRRARGVIVCLAAAGILIALQWQQLPVIRPQLAGAVCFLILLAALSQRHYSRILYSLVPGLMMLWANLHGSFIMGLGLLGCFALGRAVDVIRRSRRIVAAGHDRRTRRLFLLLLCAALAVLVNPYGADLYVHAFTFSQNPNLKDLIEWQRLSLASVQVQWFVAAVLLLLPLLYWSPRRKSTAEILLLAGLGAATVWTSRMIVWFAPVAAYVVLLHGGALWNRLLRGQNVKPTDRARGAWTILSATGIMIAAAMSPWGRLIWTDRQSEIRTAVSQQTPVAAAEFLLNHRRPGQIFNTYEWGDYLSWVGHQHGERWPIFVASHAHLVPRSVWVDYMATISAPADWETRLQRYDVRTVVIDHLHRQALIARLRAADGWTPVFEDDVAVIFVRNEP